MKKALFYEKLENNKVQCKLCPHNCVIKEGKLGVCKVRKNVKGELYTLNYGDVTAIAIDPIEKKPLFHFDPGSGILSLGTWGCNFKCLFCQNWDISQSKPLYVKNYSPEQIIKIMKQYDLKNLAFTYSEPIVWYEFVYDTAKLAKEAGFRNVLVTNGYINVEPFEALIPYIDAMNIDLKGFNDDFYRRVIGGKKEPVMEIIKIAHKNNIHVEVTTLVVTNGNDDLNQLEEEFKFISSISKDIPLHISRYFPHYKYHEPPTNVGFLMEVYETARKYLNFVYLGNVWDPKYESTYCPNCSALIIERIGYDVRIIDLDDKGRCKICGREIVNIPD